MRKEIILVNFGEAIELARKGKQIQREGWNGKNQYVELATNISYKNAKGYVINVNHDAIGNSAFAFVGTSGVQLGWLASQADMLATDWRVVDDGPYSFQEIIKLADEFDYDDCLAKKKFPLFTRKVWEGEDIYYMAQKVFTSNDDPVLPVVLMPYKSNYNRGLTIEDMAATDWYIVDSYDFDNEDVQSPSKHTEVRPPSRTNVRS